MKLKIVTMGKVKQSFVLEGEAEYLKRLKKEISLELIEIEPKNGDGLIELTTKHKKGDLLIILDEGGKQHTSKEFANVISNEMNHGRSAITFAIGGAYGWKKDTLQQADKIISLSSLTFTYQMTRLILVEQIYRAMTIIKGLPYHK